MAYADLRVHNGTNWADFAYGIYVAPSNYTTTDSYAAVPGAKIDTYTTGAKFIGILLKEVGAANGVTFKVQGSIDDSTYTDIVGPVTAAGAEDADGEFAVAADASTEVFITPEYDSGAKAAYRYYRVQAKSTVGGSAGSAQVRMFAK